MNNNQKKLMALMLALSMCASMMTMPAVAADGTETVDNGDGTTTTTTTTTTTEDGKTVVTVEFETKDEEGNLVSEGGSDEWRWSEKDTGDGEQPEVIVELKPGENTSAAASTTEKRGDIPTDENDKNYNYIETTETERTVNATTSEVKVTVNDVATGEVGEQKTGLQGWAPVYDETDNRTDNDNNGKPDDATGKDGLFDRNYLSASNADPSKWTDIPEEGEYRYIGTGEHSKYFVGNVKVVYEKNEDGTTKYDENGNPVIKEIVNTVSGAPLTVDGEAANEILPEYSYDTGFSGSRAQNFMLMDKDGNRVFAYCCDMQTGAENGKWYSVSNLEDSDYYSDEAAEHIRAIALNGYWGTSDIPDEDGNYEDGSLESIKGKLLKAIMDGEIDRYVQVPVRDTSTDGAGMIQVDEDGNPVYHEQQMDLVEILGGMTEGEALLATQAAIWSFANGSEGVTSGIDGPVVLTPDWYRNHQIGYSKIEGEPLDDEAGARVAALYNWLMDLEAEEESSVVINENNFVDVMSLVVGSKTAGVAANYDDNQDNDVYNAELNFTLAFEPAENDDLLVKIQYTDFDGKQRTVVRRLAGENGEGQSYESITAEGGVYIIEGLQLSENEEFDFDLRLEGTQYLQENVYVYAPVGGRDISQTFVGVAEGTRNVDVSMGVTVSFDVDEDDHLVAKRSWHRTIEQDPPESPEDPQDPPQDPPQTPPQDPPSDPPEVEIPDEEPPLVDIPDEEPPVVEIPDEEPPLVDIPDEEPPLVDIPDEEPPLTDVPKTGDMNALWLGMSTLLSGGGLVGLVGMGRKGKEEA